jgi:hypothetical protein
VGPLDSPVVHQTVTVHCPVHLLAPALTLRCVSRPLNLTVALAIVAPLGTPDNPVNYSGVTLQKPEAEQFRVDLPGAPDTVRWHTGQSSALDQGSLRLVLLLSF